MEQERHVRVFDTVRGVVAHQEGELLASAARERDDHERVRDVEEQTRREVAVRVVGGLGERRNVDHTGGNRVADTVGVEQPLEVTSAQVGPLETRHE